MQLDVAISDIGNASHIPLIPISDGNKINSGTKKTGPLKSAKTIAGNMRLML